MFLPDPKDGTLYSLSAVESKALKKLPFNVQQLVASSPCRSSDGIFYSGKKIDSWFTIDASTGEKQSLLPESGKTCSNKFTDALFFGRTGMQIIIILDGKRLTKFNWMDTVHTFRCRWLQQTENFAGPERRSIKYKNCVYSDEQISVLVYFHVSYSDHSGDI